MHISYNLSHNRSLCNAVEEHLPVHMKYQQTYAAVRAMWTKCSLPVWGGQESKSMQFGFDMQSNVLMLPSVHVATGMPASHGVHANVMHAALWAQALLCLEW